MTRINVGIDPKELCDQHLVAEYRELPRLWKFVPKSKPPTEFKLGSGHVLWCHKYSGMLYDRYNMLVEEMRYRGFTVNYPTAPEWAKYGLRPTDLEISKARVLLLERINDKLKNIKPRWKNRNENCNFRISI
jgi:hypothetical protein